MNKKTLVIGASENPERYSNKAIKKLIANNITVHAIALKNGKVDNVSFETEHKPFDDIHTVTLYVGPKHQKQYFDYIAQLNPQRVIFNPGTENNEFQEFLAKKEIPFEEACTLVLLATSAF